MLISDWLISSSPSIKLLKILSSFCSLKQFKFIKEESSLQNSLKRSLILSKLAELPRKIFLWKFDDRLKSQKDQSYSLKTFLCSQILPIRFLHWCVPKTTKRGTFGPPLFFNALVLLTGSHSFYTLATPIDPFSSWASIPYFSNRWKMTP